MILVDHGLVRGGPKADCGHEEDQGLQHLSLQGQAERPGVVQPAEEKGPSGRSHCGFPHLKGPYKKGDPCGALPTEHIL